MSFFGDLVSSIGGDRAPAPPVKVPVKPIQTNITGFNAPKSGPTTPILGSQTKPVYKGTAGIIASQQSTSLKRKADEDTSDRPVKILKPSPTSSSDVNGQRSAKPNGNDVKSPIASRPMNASSKVSSSNVSSLKPAPKVPAKGSYAEIMARAKEAQQAKVPSQVGMIKHQATEKIKTSKLAERKREEQEKTKNTATPQNTKPGHKGKIDPRRRSTSPVKKGDSSTPKQIKAPRPPLHGPSIPAYKGTMNTTPKRPRSDIQQKKRSKYDEYLGTDEEEDEDDDEDGYGNGEDYLSDESDMMEEAGFDDMVAEERAAERAAKEEDARELALEAKLKREKMERKQKLSALAQKRR